MTIEQLAGLAVLIASGLALWDSLRAAPPPPRQQGRETDEFMNELMAQLAHAEASFTLAPPDPFAAPCNCGPPGFPVAHIQQQIGPFVLLRPVCLAPTCPAPPLAGSPWCLIHGLDRPDDLAHVFAAHRAAPMN